MKQNCLFLSMPIGNNLCLVTIFIIESLLSAWLMLLRHRMYIIKNSCKCTCLVVYDTFEFTLLYLFLGWGGGGWSVAVLHHTWGRYCLAIDNMLNTCSVWKVCMVNNVGFGGEMNIWLKLKMCYFSIFKTKCALSYKCQKLLELGHYLSYIKPPEFCYGISAYA